MSRRLVVIVARFALFVALALAPLAALATEVTLGGSVGWMPAGSQIRIYADRVQNNEFGGRSGTLRLQIWATRSPYAGGPISGYVLGTYTLGTLDGREYYYDIDATVPYRSPPYGTYYTTMTLEEYTGSGFVIADYVAFTGTYTLGTPSTPPPPGSGSLDLAGRASFGVQGSSITVRVAEVSNNRTTGVSGTLRLRLWATRRPYAGGGIHGYVLFDEILGQLAAGRYFSDFSSTRSFQRPPKGRYYVTLTLEEYQNGRYVIVDYIRFSGRKRF